MIGSEASVIPESVRRNHWMNHFRIQSAMKSGQTAFKFMGTATTWSQAQERITAFAAALARRGVGAGDRVLLLTLNSPAVVESVVAINTLGAMAVPINFRLTPPEIAYIVDDADASVIIVDAPFVPLVAALGALTDKLGTVIVLGQNVPEGAGASFEAMVGEDLAGFEAPDIPEDTTALIMYTSGTTGQPKGAMLDHINLYVQSVTCIRANNLVGEDDIAFLTAPLFHIAGLASISVNFILGVPTVIHPLGAFNASELLDAWERERATVVFNVPTQWQAICADPTAKTRDLALRIIAWGAAPASTTILEAMAETFPNAENVAVFGQTETSPITCVLRGTDSLRKIGSVGQPIPTIAYRVVDEDMNDVPRGAVGEIIYLGPTLMKGYWRKPDETAAAFEGGWFHSGDLVRQDEEGFVWVVDRKKDMIITGGENVYCAEVENVLFGHPKVMEAALYGRADERWGEIPVAAVAVVPGESLDLAELQAWLHDHLAHYKHPKDLVLVDSLPRNAAGKVNKVQLRNAELS